MTDRDDIRFILNGREISVCDVGASRTLLDFLRLDRRLTGTKEGCAEGDCGACTVLVGRLSATGLVYAPSNACIRFLASVDGCHVVTVEHLSRPEGRLHPVQEAMIEHHGSQCGFCTPGFVMSLYALWMETPEPTEAQVETALQGNLCRCTGYAPIIRAALAVSRYGTPASDHLTAEREAMTARLAALRDGRRVVSGPRDNLSILPADVDDLADCLLSWPNATIVAGATDVGLWVTKFLRNIGPAIFTGHLDALKTVTRQDDALLLGAGASYTECQSILSEHLPHLSSYWHRIAGWQVRNMGTVGGNIANGSPIGDTPPVLIALGAEIVLRRGTERRTLPLQDFFVDYGKQDRAAGEFVESIRIPLPGPDDRNAAYKISKRRDEDISSVAAGIRVRVEDGRITLARLAFGGMAATPKRARAAEAVLTGRPWTAESFEAAAEALAEDFTPFSDWRASAGYRTMAAQNLLRRFFLEQDAGTAAPVQLETASEGRARP
ncbi:xanthine dehydrogenase small subunit [Palleronia marisminoris]|uniref:Putative xanthine dehydrogenase subunit E n=1 Tax=Palleronia marisminoris TaxID=315423 RepID=A0A1Y5SQJ5_9RHOB|nr:xanthine dehydrogenase small subunit [Palleronia marisminoris]SFG93420.1 xanthine dehydrogenase small subunit [Palleronia marisminoris]SLN45638.1 putative xanthine dehydrogenase subunit E [Palleronia marisminoris]